MRFGDPMEKDLSCLDQAILNGISEDGSTVAATIIGESGGPKGSIYIRKTDGSPPVRLGDGAALALSPDAKWVAAYTEANGSRRYVLLPTGAGEEREIAIPELKGADLVYGWSQDDETLFVHGPDAHNGLRNYVWDMRAKKLRPFGPEGVADDLPLVAPDRQQILERGPDRRWWVYPIDGGPGRALEGLGPQQHPIGWRDDSRSLYVLTHEGRTTLAVSTYDIASGRLTPWKEIHPSRPVDNAGGLQITPDGKAYAYNYLLKLSDLYVASGYK
jgi:hypothetical protein